ncbi:MAG: hypothetical protein IAI50_17315 [Candidatus Eremiobacteraeota bacterium]|nr:hypothetical protein [Candidatus Eremiobacteraeota bacterium]
MLHRLAVACAALVSLLGAAPVAAPSPSPTPSPDAEAERIFSRARAVWRDRTDVPYVRYGALVRYLHDGHVFDNWWDAYFRSSAGALSLQRLVDIDEEKHRLRGIPFSIFGVKIFDTNKDSEPIRLDEPRIDPGSSFGMVTREFAAAPPSASPTLQPFTFPSAVPNPQETTLREITRVEATARDYRVTRVGEETVAGQQAMHLHLEPLREPYVNRLRDLWIDDATYRTVQLNVQGLLNGKPYDGVLWTVHYVIVDGRQYVQQIVADQPLRFGIDTTLPKFEFDFVDFHFLDSVPKFTFDRPF